MEGKIKDVASAVNMMLNLGLKITYKMTVRAEHCYHQHKW